MPNDFLLNAFSDDNDYRTEVYGQSDNVQDAAQKRNFWDDVLPTVLKDAYNKSITGTVQEMYTGEKRFDLPTYNPTVAQDLAAEALSFIATPDILALLVPGGIATKMSSKAILKGQNSLATRASKVLAKRGNMKEADAFNVVKDVIQAGSINAATLGTYDGLHKAAEAGRQEILKQGISLKHLEGKSEQEIYGIMAKEGMKGLFKGAALGQISGVARALRWTGGYGKIPGLKSLAGDKNTTRSAAGFLNEMVAFGAAAPIFEGRAPRGQDFLLAGATFGALKTAPAAKNLFTAFGSRVRKDALSVSETITVDTIDDITGLKTTQIIEPGDNLIQWLTSGIIDKIPTGMTNKTFQPVLSKRSQQIRDGLEKKYGQDGHIFIDKSKMSKSEIKEFDLLASDYGKDTMLDATRQVSTPTPKAELGFKSVQEFKDVGSGTLSVGRGPVRILDFIKDEKGFKTGELRISLGTTDVFKLDVANAEKMFQNYSANPRLIDRFNRSSKIKFSKFADETLERRLSELKEGELAAVISYADDFAYGMNSSSVSSGTLGPLQTKLLAAQKAGKQIDLKSMSSKDKFIINQYITGKKQTDRVFAQMSDKDKKNLINNPKDQSLFSIAAGESTISQGSVFGNFINGMKTGSFQIKHPAARKTLRYLDVIDGEVTVRQGEYLSKLEEGLDMHLMATNSKWNSYVRGSERVKGKVQEPKYTAQKDLENENALSEILDSVKSTKGKEQAFHQKRFKTIQKLQGTGKDIGILPEIYNTALKDGVNVAPFLANFFPKKMKKDFIAAIYAADGKIQKEIIAQFDERMVGKLDSAGLEPSDKEAINKIVESYLKEINEKVVAKKGLQNLTKAEQNEYGVSRMFIAARRQLGPSASLVDVYNAVRTNMYDNVVTPFYSLESRRKSFAEKFASIDLIKAVDDIPTTAEFAKFGVEELGAISESLLEKDALVVLSDYAVGAAKRSVLVKNFGRNYEVLEKLKSAIPDDAPFQGRLPRTVTSMLGLELPTTERQAVQLLEDVITGDINRTQSTTRADVLKAIANFEMITKINLGYATIPNLTQQFISTFVSAGYWRFIKGMHKYATDSEFRNTVKTYTTLQTQMSEIVGVDAGTQVVQAANLRGESITNQFISLFTGNNPDRLGTLTNITGKLSLFDQVNQMNQIFAGATSQVLISDLRNMAKGKSGTGAFSILDNLAPEMRKRYAKNRLQKLGFNIDRVLKQGFMESNKTEVARVMNKFARDSQLQRSFSRDNIMFHHPDMKPFLLFKRFGYRQAEFAYDTLKSEYLNGNVMPIFAMGAAGLVGGQGVLYAKEKMDEILTGSSQYSTRKQRMKLLNKKDKKGISLNTYIEGLASVGAFGMMGDLISDDKPLGAVKFFITPVIVSDMERIANSLSVFIKKSDTFKPDYYIPAAYAAQTVAPVFGTVTARLSKRLRTPKMEMESDRQKKRDTIVTAKDFIIGGKPSEASKIVEEYNKYVAKRFPSLLIEYEDFSYEALIQDMFKRNERKLEEYDPEKHFKL